MQYIVQYNNRFRYACKYSGNLSHVINAIQTSMERELRSDMYVYVCNSLVTIYIPYIVLPNHCQDNQVYTSLVEDLTLN